MYAHDLQIFLNFLPSDGNDAIKRLNKGLTHISKWANKFGKKVKPREITSN